MNACFSSFLWWAVSCTPWGLGDLLCAALQIASGCWDRRVLVARSSSPLALLLLERAAGAFGKAGEALTLHFVHGVSFITRDCTDLKLCDFKGHVRSRQPLEVMLVL